MVCFNPLRTVHQINPQICSYGIVLTIIDQMYILNMK